jgi:hypothetical protein
MHRHRIWADSKHIHTLAAIWPPSKVGELATTHIADQAGVCHGDVQAGNIMLLHDDGKGDDTQAVLLDFSHACFKTDLHPKSWTSRKERDYAMLQSTFAGAKASLVRILSWPS